MQTSEITSILNMPKGSSIIYHFGSLAIDRFTAEQISDENIVPRSKEERQAVNDTAIIAQRLADEGKVALVQRRRGKHQYEYIAQRLGR